MTFITNLYYKISFKLDQTICEVPINKRFVAYLVDWFVGSIFMFLIPVYCYSIITGNAEAGPAMQFSNYPAPYPLIMAGISIAMACIYWIVIPTFVWEGQTFGKRCNGFKIVQTNDQKVNLWVMCKRQVLGIFVLEGALFSVSNVLHQVLFLVSGVDLGRYLMYIGAAISIVSCMMVMLFVARRMLHDYIAKTKVILAEKKA